MLIEKFDYSKLDEIVFTNRNKSYGAYQLRKKYNQHVVKGIITSAVVFSFLCFSIFISFYYDAFHELDFLKNNNKFFFSNHEVKEVEINFLPAPPLPPSITKVKKEFSNEKSNSENQIIQENDEIAAQKIRDSILKEKVQFKPKDKDKEAENDTNRTQKSESKSEYFYAQDLPQFHGGTAGLKRFIGQNLIYPQYAVINKISGVVYVTLCIDSLGKIINAGITKSVHPVLDSAALLLIRKMPRWIPSKNPNKNLKTCFTLPIQFSLKAK